MKLNTFDNNKLFCNFTYKIQIVLVNIITELISKIILFVCVQSFHIYNYQKMDIQLPKATKFIIRHQLIKQSPKPINIFGKCSQNNLESSFVKPYFVVGDVEFKRKFCDDHSPQRMNKTLQQFKSLQQTGMNTTFCNMTMQIEDGTILSKLSKDKQLSITRDKRTFNKIQQNKSREERIKHHLKKRLSHFGTKQVNSTMTFEQQQIQYYPNPQLIDLINDNIPQYWKNSLRDNEKRLKRHIKGHTFKNQIAQEMLQTMKGRKKLITSIPRIKQQFFSPTCSRSNQKHEKKKGFSLMGRKFSEFMNSTMRDCKNKTMAQIPQLRFEEVHKIHYSSGNRWRAFQLA